MLALARSARAAAAGSSLARLIRLPVVSWSCSEVELGLAAREDVDAGVEGVGGADAHGSDLSVYRPICSSVSNTDCATCSSLAAAW